MLVAAGRLHDRRTAPVPVGPGQLPKKDGGHSGSCVSPVRAHALIGAVAETPGATYMTALQDPVAGKSSTATQALAVVAFVFIEFALVIIRSRS